jgi:hypothetical protein
MILIMELQIHFKFFLRLILCRAFNFGILILFYQRCPVALVLLVEDFRKNNASFRRASPGEIYRIKIKFTLNIFP